MRRQIVLIVALVAALSLVAAGCSKSKVNEQGQIAQLEAQVKDLEGKNKELTDQKEKDALKAAEEKRALQDAMKAQEIRLIHDGSDAFRIDPAAMQENGWMVIEGERTFILKGHEQATRVKFYWADATNTSTVKAELLGEDSVSKDGWSWKGTLPYGFAKAFWAEVQYPNGITVKSPVLAVRNAGK